MFSSEKPPALKASNLWQETSHPGKADHSEIIPLKIIHLRHSWHVLKTEAVAEMQIHVTLAL